MGDSSGAVDTRGVRDFQRDLKKLSKELGKGITQELRVVGNKVRDKARSSADVPRQTGALADSVKTSVRASQVSLYSTLPYAGVHEYGGTISPRGAPIEIKASGFVRGAVLDSQGEVIRDLEHLIDNLARRYGGFH